MRSRILTSLFMLAVPVLLTEPRSALAMVIFEVEHTCPIDGTKFTAPTAMSGTSFGTRLDLRKIGPIASPWLMVTCPGNGFPLFEDEFSAAEIATLKAFAATDEYKALVSGHEVYYVVARLQRLLGRSRENIAFSLLSASWQAEDKDDPRALAYLDEALPLFDVEAEQPAPSDDASQAATLRFLTIELRRRLGRFEEAGTLLEKHRAALAAVVPTEFMALEGKLIGEKVSTPATPGERRKAEP